MRNKHLYPENWHDEIRPKILAKQHYKCKICKIKHRSTGYYDFNKQFVECDNFMIEHAKKLNFKLQKIILQIHHKNGDRKNNEEYNLVALCPKCHLAEEKELNKLKRKLKGIIYKK